MKMNTYLKHLGSLAVAALALTSCLDYDTPGTELNINQSTQDQGQITYSSGRADVLDWQLQFVDDATYEALADKEGYVSESQFKAILQDGTISTMLGQALGGQFCLRGGKEGQYPGEHSYQRYYSLFLDNYAEYFCVPHSDFMYGTLKSTYDLSSPDFFGGPYSHYTMMKDFVIPLLNQEKFDSIPELKALELLVYSQGAQEAADIHGPLPYNDHKANKQSSPFTYDNVRSIYYNIVANLDSIIVCLENYPTRPDWYKNQMAQAVGQYFQCTYMFGASYSGDALFEPYIRWANSIKLRMAMHIVKVEPETAKKWAEEAVRSGVVETTDQQILLDPIMLGFSHPLNTIFNSWGDSRLAAFMECLIMSLGHPYSQPDYIFACNGGVMSCTASSGASTGTGTYYDPKTGQVVVGTASDEAEEGSEVVTETLEAGTRITGMYSGVKPGLGQSGAGNPMIYYSSLTTNGISMCPLYLVKLSEVCFLRAEGALRGWDMGGTAQYFYEEGIKNGYIDNPMMDIFGLKHYWDDTIDEYMQRDAPLPYTYHDPLGNVEDIVNPITIGVKWNDGDSQEVKLEKIITQKYLALFPTSNEAWVDIRRTGYPRVFPVLNYQDGDGSLSYGDIIRRMPFPASDESSLKDVQDTGIDALGGPDLQGTRLWWDVDTSNF